MYSGFGNDVRVQAVAKVYGVDIIAVRMTELARSAAKCCLKVAGDAAMAPP